MSFEAFAAGANVIQSAVDSDREEGRYRQTRGDSLRQADIDNQFRTRQNLFYEAQVNRANDREDRKLQLLKQDAAKAGISLMAALGHGGSSPVNITVPSGQGGRVAGTYQRPSALDLSSLMLIGRELDNRRQTHSVTNMNEAQAEYWFYRAMRERAELSDYVKENETDLEQPLPALYLRGRDNTSEARQWYNEGYIPYLNPEYNFEMPETVGAGYFFYPRMVDPNRQDSGQYRYNAMP